MESPNQIRNVAVIAHVDHGKTSMVDGLLREARVFRDNEAVATCVMDRHDLERERGITIFSKACSVTWGNCRLNIIDTPGHADFGGEVERVLGMADAALVLVCAHDGPMPQTRFVLRKALQNGLSLIVVVNKVDRRDARPAEVLEELYGLLIDLGGSDELLESPVFYASAKEGRVARSMEEYKQLEAAGTGSFAPLLQAVEERVRPPQVDPDGPLRLYVSQLDWDDYVGRIALGRISRGSLRAGQRVLCVKPDGSETSADARQLYRYAGLERQLVEQVCAGDIVFVAGLGEVDIGDTVCAPDHPEPFPAFHVDPPTVAMDFVVTDSPFRGRDGDRITSRQLRERLYREARANVALKVEDAGVDSFDRFVVKGRGLLHLGILVEEMRREGYEFSVSRPRVIERTDEKGNRLEPIEDCVVDVTESKAGKAIEILGMRRGELVSMVSRGEQQRLEFVIPSRGLIGVRAQLLNATAGEATLAHQLREYGPWRGPLPRRTTGVQVAMETGRVTAYAIEALENRGQLFVNPGDEVYLGQVVGEHRRPEDIDVNVCKKKALTNVRSANSELKVVLAVPRSFGVEEALAYIEEDELVEVTPKFVRLRKQVFDPKARKRALRSKD